VSRSDESDQSSPTQARLATPVLNRRTAPVNVTPTLTHRPIRQRYSLNIRRRGLLLLARDLTAPPAPSPSSEYSGSSTFWSDASGVNVIGGKTPMTEAEETQYLKQQIDRMASLLHIDARSPAKLGCFVGSLRLDSGESP